MSLNTYNQTIKYRLKKLLNTIGYDFGYWNRTVMYEQCSTLINKLNPYNLDTLEISAGDVWKQTRFKSYTEMNYPEFDICNDTLEKKFDLIIADQVFEHLLYPYRAAKNVHKMLKPEGYFLITVPFLIKVHHLPHDCTRWTKTGIKYFLNECGFSLHNIITGSWGNRACVKANFKEWARYGWFSSLKNEPDFPVSVWALAKKM
jgi:SAM-dependent methyltransferase